jgi:hypothetical protein
MFYEKNWIEFQNWGDFRDVGDEKVAKNGKLIELGECWSGGVMDGRTARKSRLKKWPEFVRLPFWSCRY